MANIKSQIKRNKQNEKRRLRNRIYRGSARVAVRNARKAMDAGDAQASSASVLEAVSALDKAAEKGVIHRNNAARRKSRLMKRLSAIGLQAAGSTPSPAAEMGAEAPEAAQKKPAAAKPARKPAVAKKPAAAKATKKPAPTKKAPAKKSTKK